MVAVCSGSADAAAVLEPFERDARDADGNTALDFARGRDHTALIRLLSE